MKCCRNFHKVINYPSIPTRYSQFGRPSISESSTKCSVYDLIEAAWHPRVTHPVAIAM